ncbi:MAG: elongation factor G [Patescibacteria group bacterium]
MPRRYLLPKVRNIGFIAHISAGKTTTTERFLFYTGISHKLGSTDEGTTVTNFMVQEQERKLTIKSAAVTCYWTPGEYLDENYLKKERKPKYQINIIDTPGHIDFTAEVQRSLRVLDGAVVIFDGVSGVEPQSETVWHQADKFRVPRICFVNKMDRLGVSFEKGLESILQKLTPNAVAIQIPIGAEDDFKGVIDLLKMRALYFEGESGEVVREKEIPQELLESSKAWREKLIERIVAEDEKLMEKYLANGEISIAELKQVLRKGVLSYKLIPVLCGTSFRNKGVQPLVDAVVDFLPSPIDLPATKGIDPKTGETIERRANDDEPFSALAFKVSDDPYAGSLTFFRVYSGHFKKGSYLLNTTTGEKERIGRILRMYAAAREDIDEVFTGDIASTVGLKNTSTGHTLCEEGHSIVLEEITFPDPVISAKIEPKTKDDEEKLAISLKRLTSEDPTFKAKVDPETRETIISGMGELHLEIIVDRLKREFNAEVNVGKPQVAYKETILKAAEAEGKYIRQSGGRGQYGHVFLRVEPRERGKGYQFVDAIKRGAIPKEFISSIEKGVVEAKDKGVLAGYPLVDFNVTLFDGSFHEVDSSEFAFKIAGSMALNDAVKKASPVLLEPIMKLEVRFPEEFLGAAIGNLSARRARIEETKSILNLKVIDAMVPLAEMFGYATNLRSLTEGRGTFTMEFDHYGMVPKNIQEKIKEGKV